MRITIELDVNTTLEIQKLSTFMESMKIDNKKPIRKTHTKEIVPVEKLEKSPADDPKKLSADKPEFLPADNTKDMLGFLQKTPEPALEKNEITIDDIKMQAGIIMQKDNGSEISKKIKRKIQELGADKLADLDKNLYKTIFGFIMELKNED